jgi:hypothetical protein
METEIKNCLACNKTLRGRADKKFCDDYCRSNYNNLQKIKDKPDEFVKNINNTLLKNRKILLSILPETEEMAKVTADKLLEKGFVFKYHTHTYKNKKDQVYFFCYEYGYLPLGENWYLVVRRKEG